MNAFPRRAGAPVAEAISLERALIHLKEASDGGENDAYIQDLITAARESCEEQTERTLVHTSWRLTLDAFPAAICLLRPPIVSIESVQYLDMDGVWQTLDPADYELDRISEPGYLVPAPGRRWPDTADRINAVVVAYRAGYGESGDSVPMPIRQWMLLAVGDMYSNRNASGERPVVQQGFGDALLAPYRMVGI